jgi:hypothetical protein
MWVEHDRYLSETLAVIRRKEDVKRQNSYPWAYPWT